MLNFFVHRSSSRQLCACSAVAALCVALATAGCGPSGPAVSMVTGMVTLDGSPLSDAIVEFTPVENPGSDTPPDGIPAVGKTQADGSFTLNAQGAAPGAGTGVGNYIVTIKKAEYPQVENISEDDPRYGTPEHEALQRAADNAKPTYIVPQPYGLQQTSGLTAKVGSGVNEFTFALDSKFSGEK